MEDTCGKSGDNESAGAADDTPALERIVRLFESRGTRCLSTVLLGRIYMFYVINTISQFNILFDVNCHCDFYSVRSYTL